MILAAEDLRSHISWSPTSIAIIVRAERSGNAQISDMSKTFAVQDDVLRFYIPMNDSLSVEVFQAQKNANYQEFRLLFVEFLAGKMVPQITTRKIVQ